MNDDIIALYLLRLSKEGILDFIGVWGEILADEARKPHPPDFFTDLAF